MSEAPDGPTVLDDGGATHTAPVDPDRTVRNGTSDLNRSADDGPTASTARLGRYTIRGHLGAGGMGEVLSVYDGIVGREVAAKTLKAAGDPAQAAKFVLEAQVTGQLEHPAIVPLHELGQTPTGELFFTMKQIEGRDLASLLADPDEVRLPGALMAMFVKVCEAMAYAHSKGVIHRDLKPANVMIGSFGEVLVCDWGLAKVLGQEDLVADGVVPELGQTDGALQTLDGAVMGTPAYMAPEQAAGRVDEIDALTDVYALGALLYHMLTLAPPYEGPSPWDVVAQVKAAEPIAAPVDRAGDRHVPDELAAIAMKALSHDRADRYGTVLEMKADIEAYLEGRLVGAARYSRRQRLRKWAARHRLGVAVVLTGVLAAGAVGGVWGLKRWQSYRARQDQIRTARDAVDSRATDPRLAEHRRAAAALPVAVRACRVAPSLDQQRVLAVLLQELGGLADAHDVLLRLVPGDARARARLPRLLGEMADLALVNRDFTLAAMLVSRGRAVAPADDRLARLAQRAVTARSAQLEAHADRIATVVEQARRDAIPEAVFGELVAELASFREQQTLDLLRSILEALTREMRACLARAVRPHLHTDEERRDWDASLAQFVLPPAPRGPLDATRRARIDGLKRRLTSRFQEARPSGAPDQLALGQWLGRAQGAALPAGGRSGQIVRLVCAVMAQLPLGRRELHALGAYMMTDRDAHRSAHAGRALARHSATSDFADAILLRITGRDGGVARWEYQTHWWASNVGPIYRGLGRGGARDGPARAPADDGAAQRALALSRDGDHEAALALLDRSLAEGEDAALLNARAQVRSRLRQFQVAKRDLDRALRLMPGSAAVWHNRANVQLQLGDHRAAESDLTEAIRLDPELRSAYLHRAEVRARLGDAAGVASDFAAAVKLRPEPALRAYGRGRVAELRKHTAAALEHYQAAVRADPQHVDAQLRLGILWRRAGKLEAAAAAFRRALEASPRNVVVLLELGALREQQGDQRAAREVYDRGLKIAPRHAELLLRRGASHARLGDDRRSRADFLRATEVAPQDYRTWLNLGSVRGNLGDLKRARADLDRAVALAPAGHGLVWVNRARVRQKLGDRVGALADVERALREAPGHREALTLRAELTGQVGRDTALQELDAILADPARHTVELLKKRIAIHKRMYRYAAMIADLTRLLELDPSQLGARLERGVLVCYYGSPEDKRAWLAEVERLVKERPQDAQVRIALGTTYGRFMRYPEAVRELERGLAGRPRDYAGWVALGNVRMSQRRRAEAREAFERAVACAPPDQRGRMAKFLEANFGGK